MKTNRARSRSTGPDGATHLAIPLSQVGQGDLLLVGGKAVSLAALMRASLPVPPGFCITAEAFQQFLEGCPRRTELSSLLSQALPAQPDEVQRLSEQVFGCLDRVAVPQTVARAILAEWRACGTERAYAVRSSATLEDAAAHSFAGQFDSFLNVQDSDALIEAVRRCWLSLFSARALMYHAKNGLPVAQSAMAVVVQEMVHAEVAGVLFTIDPTTRKTDRVVIESAAGLGDRVVGGRVAPDRIILDKSSLTVRARTSGGQVPGARMVLDERSAQQLAVLSRCVEETLAGPLDIEWAIHGGAIYLLQARPAGKGHRPVRSWKERQIWS
ncbi:MAG TPA: PEP/pyruvate-binding domain-containing protein [Verrucomicrobiae bacterium]|nr:PEP/pyruvate-binding domain-containing protein [Verrucomicrobiae bacterium]